MFSGPLEGLLRAAGTVSEKQLCLEGSTGTKRVYTLNRRRAKKLIPESVRNLTRRSSKTMLNVSLLRSFVTCLLLWSFPANSALAAGAGKGSTVQVLRLSDGVSFQMGNVDARRILHPEMGATNLTFNYGVSEPGHEFPQHVHDGSDDTILVLQGQADLRQGDSLRPLLTGQAAFVPAGQIHGTITTGTGTAILISFQCPPDKVLYTGARDSSRPGAAQPKGEITPGAVKFLDFANRNGFFVHPGMGATRGAAAHRRMKPGEGFRTEVGENGEQFLFVWKGAISVKSKEKLYRAGKAETVFVSGRNSLEVRNDSSSEAIVIQVQAPPHFTTSNHSQTQ